MNDLAKSVKNVMTVFFSTIYSIDILYCIFSAN